MSDTAGANAFWRTNQPGFRFSSAEIGTQEFFEDVARHRYELEPHILQIVHFGRYRERDVLEAGCGIATDGLEFARAGARYTGLDFSPEAIELASRRFELFGVEGRFVSGSVTNLPFDDESFDLVYSHGVVHHVADTKGAIEEFHRVLRPGGTALVMVYHRASLNYYINIMVLRRALALFLLAPNGVPLIARVTGESNALLDAHRRLLRDHGRRYLLNRALFLSHNTDGPGNRLSKAYTRNEARALFQTFDQVHTGVRFLNLRIWPGGDRLAATRLARRLERRIGWHLYVRAEKGVS